MMVRNDASGDRAEVARNMLRAGNLGAARRYAMEALESDPDDVAAALTLAFVEMEEGDHAQSCALADAIVERHPNSADAHAIRIRLVIASGALRKAREAFKQFETEFPEAQKERRAIRTELANARGREKDVIRSVAERREAGESGSHLDRVEAKARLRQGDYRAATRAANRTLEAAPGDISALAYKAIADFRRCRLGDAREGARELRERAPEWGSLANEIIVASYLAAFPPFFVIQMVARLVHAAGARLNTWVTVVLIYLFGPVLLVPVLLTAMIFAAFIPGPHSMQIAAGSMGLWVGYSLLLFGQWGRWAPKRLRRTVRLATDY